MDREIVYIAGPYTNGDVAENVRKAIDIGIIENDKGNYAVIPHLTHFMHMIHYRSYDYWTKLDYIILPKCDRLVRLTGYSPGADEEVKLAKHLGKSIEYK